MTLTELCKELRNWFEKAKYFGAFRIVNGEIDLSELVADGSLQVGQYFRICGSVFNDGVYMYPCQDLMDEEWEGAVWLLAIPTEVIELSEEIDKWKEQYGTSGPFTSESFAGYSYTKATAKNGGKYSWKDEFADQLKRWRKICPY